VARIYDCWLGGSHNFAVDREVARQVVADVPDTPLIMQANRAFLYRAVSYLVDAGVRQFLDIGSGMPTLGNVHEVAQKRAPDARVVYVDIDPVAVAHSRHILDDNEHATVIQEDLRRPGHILAHPDVRQLLDFDQPMAVLTLAVLHFIADADDPPSILAHLRDAVAPGSYLVLSHGTADAMQGKAERPLKLLSRTSTPPTSRTRTEVERLFAGFDLIEPGLVWAPQWRPEDPEDVGDHPERSANYVGVGRKP
jgi:SAM-dependent methyltransferase